MHIVLIGMMGAGKSTIGSALAARLGVTYADNDAALRARTGRDAATVLAEDGVEALHRIERDLLAEALLREDGAVIGAPGSVALDASAPGLLAGHQVVWLRARPDTLAARVHRDAVRPLLGDAPVQRIRELLEERQAGFERLATQVVDVDDLAPGEVADRITAAVPPALR